MTLDELVENLNSKLLQTNSLEVLCYYFINKDQNQINQFDKSDFIGEVEQVAVKSFSDKFAESSVLRKVIYRIEKNSYKGLNIYHYAGLFYQDKLNDTALFSQIIKGYFENHSFKFKYLLAKVFTEFEETLKIKLQAEIETKDDFILVLKHLYLETEINKNKVLAHFNNELDSLDIIDLLLLEDLQNIKAIGYNKIQEGLLTDIFRCVEEIQSKHKVQNNKEDQYNSIFQSLLNFTGKYHVLDQTQRGQSPNRKQYGELDIAIFTKDNFPLSILEAFVIDSVEKEYITEHLKKLSEDYDPNGLKNNYAVIYAKSNNFIDFWERYKNFVPTINFEHKLISNQIEDITSRFPQYTGIRIGLTKHINRGLQVQIYHIFMDMNFPS
jgi:hypothetical protein